MINMPAICDNCYAVFPSGIVMENVTNVTFSGNKSGPCPNCGGWGHIPDGTFNVLGTVIEILESPRRTVEELKRFSDILQDLNSNKITAQEMEQEVRQEISVLAPILDYLPKTREERRSDLKFLVSTILAVIGIIITMQGNSNKIEIENKIEVEQVINKIYINQDNESKYKR